MWQHSLLRPSEERQGLHLITHILHLITRSALLQVSTSPFAHFQSTLRVLQPTAASHLLSTLQLHMHYRPQQLFRHWGHRTWCRILQSSPRIPATGNSLSQNACSSCEHTTYMSHTTRCKAHSGCRTQSGLVVGKSTRWNSISCPLRSLVAAPRKRVAGAGQSMIQRGEEQIDGSSAALREETCSSLKQCVRICPCR